ncbi:hypothetical protein VSDG_07615 [Cytospora chrysosperma]|uniref:Uncharacterized protein n=1 Tax=Cytospora chrysosperma TaxID=252740 RepID=A0A423VM00_CYTCH|nr:hypothetical protein VSDG_07615 [Valsa sordida]
MPLSGISRFFGKSYDGPLIIDDDEDEENHQPPPADGNSSMGDASGESYSAEGSPGTSDAAGSGAGKSDGRSDGEESVQEVHSFAGGQRQHAPGAGSQTKSFPRNTPATTPKTGTGILKGTGPRLLSKPSRRPRKSATYNLLALSRQAMRYSDRSPKKRHSLALDQVPRRQSEPPTYNLKELIQRTRGRPKGTKKLADKVAKRPAKEKASVSGQASSHARKWRVTDDGDDEDIPSKRPRINPDTSIADSFASEGPDVTDSALQEGDSASKPVAKRPWRDSVVPPVLQGSSSLLQYIIPWVHHGGGVLDPNGIPEDERIASLLALPMQRTIEWNQASRNRWNVSGKIDIVALLIQLTGEDPPSPCSRCTSDPKYGQWVGCKVISSKMAGEAWRLYGCANCVYHGKQTYCSLKGWSRKRATREVAPLTVVREKSRGGVSESNSSEDIDQSEASAGEAITAEAKTAQNCASGHSVYQDNDGAAMQAEPTQHQDASLVTAGGSVVMPLMMEPWEKAPGRIRSRNLGAMENIAFSKSYLANGHEVPVCKEAAFRVEIIRSGHSQQFRFKNDTLCLCSIASGKLRVKMDGEDPFTIGSHGMFRILPGSACVVENEVYDDVTMHVTSIRVEDG